MNKNEERDAKKDLSQAAAAKVIPDEYTLRAVKTLKSDFDKNVKNDIRMFERHGFRFK